MQKCQVKTKEEEDQDQEEKKQSREEEKKNKGKKDREYKESEEVEKKPKKRRRKVNCLQIKTEKRWLEHDLETDHGDGDKEEVKETRLVDLLKEDVEIAVGGGNRRQ